MAYEVNFSLLGQPVDVGAAVRTGYEHGRAMRLQAQQESAFALLARDPNSAEGRRLLVEAGRPDVARQFRQWAKEDENEAFRRRALGLPDGSPQPSAFATPNSVVAPAPAALAPAGVPPTSVSPAPAVAPPVAPSAPPAASTGRLNLNQDVMRQWFAADPAGAREFLTGWNALDDAQQEMASRKYTAAIPVLTQALSVPPDQRRAFIQSHAPEMLANGWTAQELEGFEPTDTNVQYLIRRGLPIAQQRDFFAPRESAPGAVGRSTFGNRVEFANPSAPRTETYADESGNIHSVTMPGTPAIGPDAGLFGAGVQGGQAQPQRRTATNPATGERITVEQDPQTGEWRPVTDEAPGFRPAPGGAAPGQRNFP